MNLESPTVYVVETDPDTRSSIARQITSIGISVRAFCSPTEFTDAFDRHDHGCLILGVRLGTTSGMRLFERLLDDDYMMPVIFVTAYAETELCVKAMQEGAWDFLEKPFTRNRLLDCVNGAIGFDALRRVDLYEKEAIEDRIRSLTLHETTVLDRLMAGDSLTTMAQMLNLNISAVEGHRANVYIKMGVDSLPRLAFTMARYTELQGLSRRPEA